MIRGMPMERRGSTFFGSPKPKSSTSHHPPRSKRVPPPVFNLGELSLDELLAGRGSFDVSKRAANIRDAIDDYPVQNVQEVFDYCEKLVCDDNIDTVNLGYTIISELAACPECTPLHRVTFYNKIVTEIKPKHYLHHRSYLFSYLTNQGRDIEGFESTLSALIPSFFHESTLSNTSQDVSSNNAKELGISILDSLDVLANMIKFNAKFILDAEIIALIEQMFGERFQTASTKYRKVFCIVDTLVTYTYIPRRCVNTLTKVISFWVGQASLATENGQVNDQAENIQEEYWATFAWLLSTHLKELTMDALLESLEDDSAQGNQARGAAILMYRASTDTQTRRVISLDVSRLLNMLARTPSKDYLTHAYIRLKLIRNLLQDDELQQAFVSELDWMPLLEAIVVNASRPKSEIPTEADDMNAAKKSLLDDKVMADRDACVSTIIEKLETLPGVTLTQSRTLRKLALSSATALNSRQKRRLIEAYHPSSFRISVGNWLPEIKELAQIFIMDNGPNLTLAERQLALTVVDGALRKAQELGEPEAVTTAGEIILRALAVETNQTFRDNLVYCVISFVSENLITSEEGFQTVVDILLTAARSECGKSGLPHGQSSLDNHNQDNDRLPTMLPDAGLVVLLMRSSMTHPQRAQLIYKEILNLIMCREMDKVIEGTVMLMRGLFRIRSDIEHHIFYVVSPEGESLATSLNRNANEPKHSMRRASTQFDPEETPTVWRYGEFQGLPEEPPTTISANLWSDTSRNTDTEQYHLDMTEWLRIVTDIIDSGCDWEVYSYIVVHLGAQLSNQSLFTEAIPQMKVLAMVICRKIQHQTVMTPPESSGLRQGDVAFCLLDILTTIIGYHWHFPRNDTETIVSTFIMGLTAWDTTTVPCIHALTLCCYELPVSLSRDLVRIVEKMSTIVTKSNAAIHVLEFLAGLSRLELTNRFHGDEIKTVFGVCFSYIEYARGKRYDEAQQRGLSRSVNPTRQGSVASGQRPSTEDIPQYVFAISYHVITFWFLTLRNEDQKKYLPWMEQRLLSRDQAGNVEDEALVTVDHLWRVAEGRSNDHPFVALASSPSDESSSQTWITEYCILTVSNYQSEGSENTAIEIVERRCSGTDFRLLPRPSGTTTPEQLFEAYNLFKSMDGPFRSSGLPLPLYMTDQTKRALGIFDRTSPIDYFKCGIIYIGENQTEEATILSNVSGSPDYNLLVDGLGDRVHLPSHRGNVSGLDTSEGAFDGQTTYQHSDGVTTLNYHITTLMPTNRVQDPLCTRKKSHIGNDYVNIVFNNSGLVSGFDFHTFPSAFNYVYIVITPEARQTFIQTRTRGRKPNWYQDSWFKVQVMTREDFPDISSAAETKVVSGQALAAYVRNLALNAEVFCRVWTNRGSGEYPSSWRSRLGQIRLLRERVERAERERAEKTGGD